MATIMKLQRYIDHDLQMTPIDFEVTRYIDHDSQKTPIDFEVTRSKSLLSRDNDAKDVLDKNKLNTHKVQYLKHRHFPVERPMMEIPKNTKIPSPSLATKPRVHPT
ncbi:hypothetical protein DPMN_140736 [Dreissena polymorpha]|uniref:Uncharacterized protein n=1 Tax=Dreissena polymorpha TaxID=45954 RepID=A0A9D4G8N8_DREPO|nr:hypothetical protein DPMN_140736 [Dreissena polymorpha]